jgi:hypothetical protein
VCSRGPSWRTDGPLRAKLLTRISPHVDRGEARKLARLKNQLASAEWLVIRPAKAERECSASPAALPVLHCRPFQANSGASAARHGPLHLRLFPHHPGPLPNALPTTPRERRAQEVTGTKTSDCSTNKDNHAHPCTPFLTGSYQITVSIWPSYCCIVYATGENFDNCSLGLPRPYRCTARADKRQ